MVARLLSIFYYYLLLATVASVFIFVSTFNNISDGNHHANYLQPAFISIARMMWGVFVTLHACGLFVVIILRRKQQQMPVKRVVLFTVLITVVFIIPSVYYLGKLMWANITYI